MEAILADLNPFGDAPVTNNNLEQEKTMKYRANRKKFFLTYSRCDKTPEEIYQHLSSISSIHKYLIARELHKDGQYHIHAYIEFVDKKNFLSPRWADLDGFHPNDAGAVRNGHAVEKYCTKEANFVTNYFALDPWKLIYDEDKTSQEAIELIKRERPRDYTLYSDQIERSIKKAKRRKVELKKPEIQLENWQKEVLLMVKGEVIPRRIIWIWSLDSQMGKTTFKKYVQHEFKEEFLLGSMNIRDTMYAYDAHRVIWFDIPRQQPLDADLTSQLETLSDGGIVNSSKYASQNKIVDAHIVVTTNRPPPEDKLPNRIISFSAYISSQ